MTTCMVSEMKPCDFLDWDKHELPCIGFFVWSETDSKSEDITIRYVF